MWNYLYESSLRETPAQLVTIVSYSEILYEHAEFIKFLISTFHFLFLLVLT